MWINVYNCCFCCFPSHSPQHREDARHFANSSDLVSYDLFTQRRHSRNCERTKKESIQTLFIVNWLNFNFSQALCVARSRRQAFKHFEKDNLALQIFRNVGKFVQAEMYKYNKYIYSESISQVWNAFCALLFTHVCWNQLYKLYLVELWNFTNIFSASIK